MNDTTYNQNVQESVYQPTRKQGMIVEFRTCNDEYLALISKDLGLRASVEEMRFLQKVFNILGRDPSVAELYFAYAGLLGESRNAEDRVALNLAQNCPTEVFDLLASLVRRYCTDIGNSTNAPMLTRLAEYAATGKTRQEECGIHICQSSQRRFPLPYSGKSETVFTCEYAITIFSGKPLSGNDLGDVCVLISPKHNENIDTFINNTCEICRRFLKEHPTVKISSASESGLLGDLIEHTDGLIIDTSLYSEPSLFAESVFLAFNPSLILFPPRAALPRLWEIASEYGITPYAPAATRAKFISVKAPEGSVEFDKEIFKLLKQESQGIVTYSDDSFIEECGIVPINSDIAEYKLNSSPHILSARKVGGPNLYEDLADAMSNKSAVYAIAGTISPHDGLFLQTVLTLDSYRRNNSPAVVYSRFFIGEKTSICVFKLNPEK